MTRGEATQPHGEPGVIKEKDLEVFEFFDPLIRSCTRQAQVCFSLGLWGDYERRLSEHGPEWRLSPSANMSLGLALSEKGGEGNLRRAREHLDTACKLWIDAEEDGALRSNDWEKIIFLLRDLVLCMRRFDRTLRIVSALDEVCKLYKGEAVSGAEDHPIVGFARCCIERFPRADPKHVSLLEASK